MTGVIGHESKYMPVIQLSTMLKPRCIQKGPYQGSLDPFGQALVVVVTVTGGVLVQEGVAVQPLESVVVIVTVDAAGQVPVAVGPVVTVGIVVPGGVCVGPDEVVGVPGVVVGEPGVVVGSPPESLQFSSLTISFDSSRAFRRGATSVSAMPRALSGTLETTVLIKSREATLISLTWMRVTEQRPAAASASFFAFKLATRLSAFPCISLVGAWRPRASVKVRPPTGSTLAFPSLSSLINSFEASRSGEGSPEKPLVAVSNATMSVLTSAKTPLMVARSCGPRWIMTLAVALTARQDNARNFMVRFSFLRL